jgi:hypothetical protein
MKILKIFAFPGRRRLDVEGQSSDVRGCAEWDHVLICLWFRREPAEVLRFHGRSSPALQVNRLISKDWARGRCY